MGRKKKRGEPMHLTIPAGEWPMPIEVGDLRDLPDDMPGLKKTGSFSFEFDPENLNWWCFMGKHHVFGKKVEITDTTTGEVLGNACSECVLLALMRGHNTP